MNTKKSYLYYCSLSCLLLLLSSCEGNVTPHHNKKQLLLKQNSLQIKQWKNKCGVGSKEYKIFQKKMLQLPKPKKITPGFRVGSKKKHKKILIKSNQNKNIQWTPPLPSKEYLKRQKEYLRKYKKLLKKYGKNLAQLEKERVKLKTQIMKKVK